jgi:uncharacterized membrane protein
MISILTRASNWLWITGALIAAGIVHILTVFAVANWTQSPARVLEDASPVNVMTVLARPVSGAQLMPFAPTDVRTAVCPFDLATGPLLVRTTFGEGPWTVAVFDQAGAMLYSVTNTELQRNDATLVIARSSSNRAASLPISRQEQATNITVNVPEPRGIAMVLAPILGATFEREAERRLALATCEPLAGEYVN